MTHNYSVSRLFYIYINIFIFTIILHHHYIYIQRWSTGTKALSFTVLCMYCVFTDLHKCSSVSSPENKQKKLWHYEGVLISSNLRSSPSIVSIFCDFSSSSSYRRLEMSCLISFNSPGGKNK